MGFNKLVKDETRELTETEFNKMRVKIVNYWLT